MNVDFVPFIRGVRVLCKPRLIFSRINGPIVFVKLPLLNSGIFVVSSKSQENENENEKRPRKYIM